MNDRRVKEIIKSLIQDNLEDPLKQWTGKDRIWIHSDEPIVSSSFPRIEIIKRKSTINKIISMGFNFLEQKEIILDVIFWTKVQFKWKDEDGAYLNNERIVAEYLGKIWTEGVKPYGELIRDNYQLVGLKNMGETEAKLDDTEQFYKGTVSIRVWYFDR